MNIVFQIYVLRMKVTHNWIGGTMLTLFWNESRGEIIKIMLIEVQLRVEYEAHMAGVAGIRISFRHHAALRLVYRINFKYLTLLP